MQYHYKKPGAWLWTPYVSDSLSSDLAAGKIGADWRLRPEGDTQDYSVQEAIAREAARTKATEQALARSASSAAASRPEPAAPGLATVFRVIGAMEILGGFVMLLALWPGDARDGYGWRAVAYATALTWLFAGIIFGCLFFAVAEALIYLRDIRDSVGSRKA